MKASVYGKQSVAEIIRLPKWDAKQARQVIDALDDSGMSIAKFSRAHGLNYWRVMNAKRRLKGATLGRIEPISAPALVPVTIEPMAEAVDTDNDDKGGWILEVQLSGCVVRVAASASQQAVAATLQAIRTLGC
jgi:hypothetical protein